MQIHLSPRHLTLTAAIHQAVAGHIGSLEDHGTDILGAHVVLLAADAEKPGHRYTVKVHLAVPGPDLHAEDSENDLYIALERVTDKLAQQLRKRKTALTARSKKTSKRVAEVARTAEDEPGRRDAVLRVAHRRQGRGGHP